MSKQDYFELLEQQESKILQKYTCRVSLYNNYMYSILTGGSGMLYNIILQSHINIALQS